MTTKIDLISKKLKDLQEQQQALEIRLATQLYREIQSALGEDFSPSLALSLMQEARAMKSQEDLQQHADSFPT